MATLTELVGIRSNDTLGVKIEAACAKKAYEIALEPSPSAARLKWAQDTLRNPRSAKDELFWAVVAANADFSVAQILGATDSSIETNVSGTVDIFWP